MFHMQAPLLYSLANVSICIYIQIKVLYFLVYKTKNTIKTVLLRMMRVPLSIWIYFKCNLCLWFKDKFQHHYSSLQLHMILQKSFKYADLLHKYYRYSIINIIILKLNIFVGIMMHLF